jgi:hypothetical protein
LEIFLLAKEKTKKKKKKKIQRNNFSNISALTHILNSFTNLNFFCLTKLNSSLPPSMAEKLFSLWVFLLLLHPVKPDVATPLLDGFSSGFNAAGNNLTLDGAAAVESNGVLQLTTYTSTMAPGHAFYSNPIQFKNSSGAEVMSFSTSFAFAYNPPAW